MKRKVIEVALGPPVLIEPCCTCLVKPYPHLHTEDSKELARQRWNGDSRFRIEPKH